MTIKSFKNKEGYHNSLGCKIDHELKESVYTFEVRSKEKSGSTIRTYRVLSSCISGYIKQLEEDPNVKRLELYR